MRPAVSSDPFIYSLPSSTKSKLRSTQILTSLPQLISELVQNSLDAGAQNINISINTEEWECWVRDDGPGITRNGLAMLAGEPEARRYSTSKAHSLNSLQEATTFGFRGEALASISDLCCLEICSRTKHSDETWSIILKGEQNLYAGPAIRWRRASSGTVVSVKDAFYNLPIRRRSHPNPSRTLELVRKEIESFALVFPHVSISLDDSRKSKTGLLTGPNIRVLTIPKTGSPVATFRHLYGKALANHVEQIDETFEVMRLDGFVSLEGASSKAYQFLYVNRHPLETCELHRNIEQVFAHSSFHQHAYDESGATSSPRSAARRSPRKTERKPVYVLNLTIPTQNVDNCVNPAKTAVQLQNSTSVVAFLSSVVESVLVRHGFLNRLHRLSGDSDGTKPSPRKKRKLVSANNQSPTTRLRRSSSQPMSVSPLDHCIVRYGSAPAVTRIPLPAILEENGEMAGPEDESNILWTDPGTGETFVIDARTGNSYPQNAPIGPTEGDRTAAPRTRHVRRSLGSHRVIAIAEAPAWITEALSANEAYKLAEPKIPVLTTSLEPAQKHACDHGSSQSQHRPGPRTTGGDTGQQAFAAWDASQVSRFTREDLRAVRVLGQVDRKFVACVIRPRSTSETCGSKPEQIREEAALVLIDQHAADERIRVERFLKEVCEGFLSSTTVKLAFRADDGRRKCGVRVREVESPAHILLTRHEAEKIAGSDDIRDAFARWGVTFARTTAAAPAVQVDGSAIKDPPDIDAAYVQVAVTTVPEIVADKLLSGNELQNLVKCYLARLETNPESVSHPLSSQHKAGEGLEWQKALRWCPQELIELINSKACRGAIMFNDTLTLEQCKDLVSRLSEAALPFQCAHGRPSLVPLVDTGGARCFVPARPGANWTSFMRQGRE